MKILIVKIAAIGDVVMVLPLLNHIRSQYPEAHITWICGKEVHSLVEATRQTNRIISTDESSLYKGKIWRRLLAMLKIWLKIAGHFYDLSLTCHPDSRYRWITFPIFCKERRFCSRSKARINPLPGRYHANEYLRLFTDTDASMSVPSFPKIALPSSPFLQELINYPIVAIAPGGAKNILADDALRRWPIESYTKVAKKLARLPVHLAITGSQSDFWVRQYFIGIPHIDLIGKLELLDFISFLKHCHLFITHDSGPLHLAKLAECQTIALFGPTMPSEKVGLNEKIKVLWGGEHLTCRPCYDGKTYAKCAHNICLASLSAEQVFNEAIRFLS